MNVEVLSPWRIKLTSEAYVLSMADKHGPIGAAAPSWLCPPRALDQGVPPRALRGQSRPPGCCDASGQNRGAGVHVAGVRIDVLLDLATVACTHFPRGARLVRRRGVYLAQRLRRVTFDGSALAAGSLVAYSDSDWAVGLGGPSASQAPSRCTRASARPASPRRPRQSSLQRSTQPLEVVFARRVLATAGLAQDAPHRAYVDNSGAPSRRATASRATDRGTWIDATSKFASSHGGELTAEHIDTTDNPADVLTKSLPLDSFSRHSRVCAASAMATRLRFETSRSEGCERETVGGS